MSVFEHVYNLKFLGTIFPFEGNICNHKCEIYPNNILFF